MADDLDALENRVRSIYRRGEYYRVFVRPDDDEMANRLGISDRERAHLAFLRDWGAGTVYPVLIRLYDLVDDGVATHDQVANCLEYLESFLVRRHLAAVGTRTLNRLFLGLIAVLGENEPVDEAMRRELSRDGRWPADLTVKDGVRQVAFYNSGRGRQRKLILERLEASLRAELQVDFDGSDLSIEHILPQTMSHAWKDRLKADGEYPGDVFARHGHTLGNLTLTAFNSALSNSLIERKQEILSDSELRLNDPLKNVTNWGVAEMTNRADWLGNVSVTTWSPPISGIVTPSSGFDWTKISEAVGAIPMGRWTSYGDLAELGGTAAQPTAHYVATAPDLELGYRVLTGNGAVSSDFSWGSPDDHRDPVEVLTGEGVDFDDSGRASQEQRLSPAELSELADEVEVVE